ncbi:MAG: ATP-binding protein [Candidatus Eremiobacteraeota bacterium]|nr:ATP-binding protein [Candidatus Eremiobacteraeota bacterium]MBV9647387.1 ATP-binding protein [Candidatus Eremiobacteraeota bacterium]
MKHAALLFAILTSAALAACSGGSGSSGTGRYTPPTVVPSVPPTTPPTTPPTGGVLATHNINGGTAFVDANNHAVYVFDGDTKANVSTCNGGCAAIWPPVAPPTSNLPAPFAQFTRGDGSVQLSYKGKPLYTFVNDTQPFVATGDGVNGFHVARP